MQARIPTAINHVGLVVKDEDRAMHFYVDIVGLSRHPKVASWLAIGEGQAIHIIEIPEAQDADSLYHEIQHLALEVADLHAVLGALLKEGLRPFQMDFHGNTSDVTGIDNDLSFGIGTLFVRDPDGNLVEFVRLGKGIFSE